MGKVEFQHSGKQDDRLTYLIEKTKEGARTFVEAVKNTKEYGVSFKAFTLKTTLDEEAKTVFDVMMTQIAIEIAEQAKDLIYEKTFFHTVERDNADETSLWLHCKSEKPPTKEEIDVKAKEENEEHYEGPLIKIEPKSDLENAIADAEDHSVREAMKELKVRVLTEEEKAELKKDE